MVERNCKKIKIKSLGIDKFIKNKNIIISSKYKNIKTKIDLNMIEKLTDLKAIYLAKSFFLATEK